MFEKTLLKAQNDYIFQKCGRHGSFGPPGYAYGSGGAVKESRTMQTYEKQKIVSNYACFCSAMMSTSKIIPEIIEKIIPNFLGAQIAVINLFQFDLDKPWNYLWFLFQKGTSAPVAPLVKGEGQYPPTHTSFPAFLQVLSKIPVC